MKEYGSEESWTESFRFSNPVGFPVPKALYFRKNENLLMLTTGCCYRWKSKRTLLLSIDCDRDQTEVLEAFERAWQGVYMGSYNEGLGLFNEGKTISDDKAKDEVRVDELKVYGPCRCDIAEVVSNIKIERLL